MLDKWLNTIQQMDCIEGMRQLPDKCIDLIVTDPPYHTVGGGATTISGGIFGDSLVKKGTFFHENSIKFLDWLPHIYRVLKEGTHAYIMINGRNLAELQTTAESVGFQYQNTLIWNKGNVTPNRYYMQQCEFILMFSKRPARTINNPSSKNLISIPNIIGNKSHPTEKPVSLMGVFISNSTPKGGIVLDPFMGAGSTAIACKDLGRNFIGFELEPKYVEIANKRLQQEVLL